MKKTHIIKKSFAVLIVLAGVSFSGFAQISDAEKESKNAVWKIQATSLAETYSLNKKEIAKLSDVYVKMRQEVQEQNNALDKNTDPEGYKASIVNNEKEGGEKIKKELDKILTKELAEEGLMVLGSFNSRWDSYQEVLLGFNLGKEQLSSSSQSLVEYMKLYLKARKIAAESGTRFSGQTATELKSKLDIALSDNLSPEQMAEWNNVTQRKKKSD